MGGNRVLIKIFVSLKKSQLHACTLCFKTIKHDKLQVKDILYAYVAYYSILDTGVLCDLLKVASQTHIYNTKQDQRFTI